MPGLNRLFNKLIGNGIDKKNAEGDTRLYQAVKEGNLTRVKKLLKKGADPDVPNALGLTPLHQAAYWDEVEILDVLLKGGADANADNGRGWTPLHSAALSGGLKSRSRIIARLKQSGARDGIPDKNGWTASDYMSLWDDNTHAAEKLKQFADKTQGSLPDLGDSKTPADKHARPKGPGAPKH